MGEAEGKKNSEKLTNSQFIQDCILQGRFSLCVYLPPFLQNMTLRVAAHSQACHLKCKKQTNKQGVNPHWKYSLAMWTVCPEHAINLQLLFSRPLHPFLGGKVLICPPPKCMASVPTSPSSCPSVSLLVFPSGPDGGVILGSSFVFSNLYFPSRLNQKPREVFADLVSVLLVISHDINFPYGS